MADPVAVAMHLCTACTTTFKETGTLEVYRVGPGIGACEHRRPPEPASVTLDLFFRQGQAKP